MHPSPDWTISQALEWGFIPIRKPGERWQRDCRVALSYWRQKTADPTIRQITSSVAQSFVDGMQKDGYSSATVRSHWGRLSRVISWFYKKDNAHRHSLGLLSGRPPQVLHKARRESRSFNPLSLSLYEAWWKYHRSELVLDAAPTTLAEYEITLRQWECHTHNPSIGEISNMTLDEFKAALTSRSIAAATVNKRLRHVRAILRRLGPQETRNPAGLGLLCRVPYTKRLRESAKLPRTIGQQQLSAILDACDTATWPAERKVRPGRGNYGTKVSPGYGAIGTGIPPALFWRVAVVLAYNLGLSKEDLFGLRHDEVDFDEGLITFERGKTHKHLRLPINEHVRDALLSIWRPDEQKGLFYETKSNRQLYAQWHAIQETAGIPKPYFGFHDIRRTCATEFERLQAGAGTFMLGHSNPAVTWRHYRNPSEATKQAAAMLPQPRQKAGGKS